MGKPKNKKKDTLSSLKKSRIEVVMVTKKVVPVEKSLSRNSPKIAKANDILKNVKWLEEQ